MGVLGHVGCVKSRVTKCILGGSRRGVRGGGYYRPSVTEAAFVSGASLRDAADLALWRQNPQRRADVPNRRNESEAVFPTGAWMRESQRRGAGVQTGRSLCCREAKKQKLLLVRSSNLAESLKNGAGGGNRTRTKSLGSFQATTTSRPRSRRSLRAIGGPHQDGAAQSAR